MADGAPLDLTYDLGPVPKHEVETIRKAQITAASLLGYECAEILDMLGIRRRV
jgi:hypothetical protein